MLTTVLLVAVTGHLAVQTVLVHAHAGIQERARGEWRSITRVLEQHHVRPPCVLRGNSSAIPIAYTAGCSSEVMDAPGLPDAVVLRNTGPPEWAETWPRYRVPDTYNPGWSVAVRP